MTTDNLNTESDVEIDTLQDEVATLRARLAQTEWALLEVNVEKTRACWLWRGRTTSNGYGRVWYRGRERRAHRVSWEIANERPIPQGLYVCHRCDVRLCVRPDHLFIGTQSENMRDAANKGRFALQKRPELMARLTPDAVVEIRRRVAAGESRRLVAREHGIHKSNVDQIVWRKTWRHIP